MLCLNVPICSSGGTESARTFGYGYRMEWLAVCETYSVVLIPLILWALKARASDPSIHNLIASECGLKTKFRIGCLEA